MEIFCYSAVIETEHLFYVSLNGEKVTVTCSIEEEKRIEKMSELTWGVCLRNIVLFGLSVMNQFEFEVQSGKFKKQLTTILKRIRQFQKLGDIKLSKNVMLLFLQEHFNLLSLWFDFLEKGMIEDKLFAIRSTIGLLITFHAIREHI